MSGPNDWKLDLKKQKQLPAHSRAMSRSFRRTSMRPAVYNCGLAPLAAWDAASGDRDTAKNSLSSGVSLSQLGSHDHTHSLCWSGSPLIKTSITHFSLFRLKKATAATHMKYIRTSGQWWTNANTGRVNCRGHMKTSTIVATGLIA